MNQVAGEAAPKRSPEHVKRWCSRRPELYRGGDAFEHLDWLGTLITQFWRKQDTDIVCQSHPTQGYLRRKYYLEIDMPEIFYLAAHFPSLEAAGQAYTPIQQMLRSNEDADFSLFPLELGEVVGRPPTVIY